MEKSIVPPNLSGTARCLIICSTQRYSIDPTRSIKDIADQANNIVKDVTDYAKADYNKAILLGLFLSAEKLYIVFDYDNPGHDDCKVIAFGLKKNIKHLSVPAAWVHGTVKTWKNYPHLV